MVPVYRARIAIPLAAAATLLLAGARVVHAAEQVRYAVIVGNNQGNAPARSLRYAEQEVTRLSGILKERGDFEGMVVLRGSNRQEVELALRAARGKLEEARAAGKPTLFLFYYSGHGDNEALELGGTRFALRDLRTYLETLPADVRLAFVDACQSGALTGVKGGHRAPAYEVRLADPGTVRGMAIVTSSTANELSQESDDLQGSYFSHNIMAGLKGLADTSRDGQVTLSELYNFAFRRTLAGTAASLIGGQHPTYVYQMSGTGEVILTRTRPKDAQVMFPREAGVTYSVLHRGEVAAELVSSAEQDLYLALPAGEYKVVRRQMAQVAARDLTLSPGISVNVEPSTMAPVPVDETRVARKKQSLDAYVDETPNLLGAQLGLQTPVVSGASAFASAGLSYLRSFPYFALRVRGELGQFGLSGVDPARQEFSHEFLRIAPALDFLLPLYRGERLSFFFGPTAGAPIMRQTSVEGFQTSPAAWSYGFSYGGIATLGVRVARGLDLQLSVTGGGELAKNRDRGEVEQKPVAAAALGAAWAF